MYGMWVGSSLRLTSLLSRSEAATDLIAEFPGPITLRPSRLKWWSVAAIGAGMTALCIWLAIFFELHPERVEGNPHVGMAALLCCAAIFAIGALVPFAALRRGCLSLSADSFEVTDMHGKTTVYDWNHVSDFDISVLTTFNLVVFKSMSRIRPP